jgi:nucleoside-diphosphate-sugar epimerase
MHIFVTGATGFIGAAVVSELIASGHTVLGLTRSDAGAAALLAAGAQVHRGDLQDLDSLRAGTHMTDGVIHTAFDHDFSKFAISCESDKRAIEALGQTLLGSQRPLLVASGLSLINQGALGSERDLAVPASADYPRTSEAATLALAARGVNARVVRLPPSVHGDGDRGFVPTLINIARASGVSAFIGDGQNLWPAVHRHDGARVFSLAMEQAKVGGPFHAVGEEGVPFRAIAEVIGRRLSLPVVSKTVPEAEAHFGWFSFFARMNIPTSSRATQDLLGWKPSYPDLLSDIDQDCYFAI